MKLRLIVLASLLVSLFLVQPAFALTTHTFELPSNTLFFDDFERVQGSGLYWNAQHDGAGFVNGRIVLNATSPLDGSGSLFINQTNNSNFSDQWAVRTISLNTTTIGVGCIMAFSNTMVTVGDGQAVLCGAMYYDTRGYLHEVRVEYRTNLCQWVLFASNNATDNGAASPFILQTLPHCHRGYDDTASQWFPDTYITSKIIFDRSANKYIGFYSGDLQVTFGPNGYAAFTGSPIGTLSTFVTFPPRSDLILYNAIALDTHTVKAGALFDNFIVTDETPGNPKVIQFGLVGASSIFTLIMVATALMYTSSGIALTQRVFRQKVNSPLTSPKFIITTGAAGTIGFLLMIIIGAGFTRACPAGFTCVG